MKSILAMAFTAATLLPGAAFAAGQGNQGGQAPAAPTANCVVQDSSGQQVQIKTQNQAQATDGSVQLTGSSDEVEYLVTLRTDKSAQLSFTDKRSGDKAVVDEGEFSAGEHVGVTLVTDEAPKAPISLICTAQ